MLVLPGPHVDVSLGRTLEPELLLLVKLAASMLAVLSVCKFQVLVLVLLHIPSLNPPSPLLHHIIPRLCFRPSELKPARLNPPPAGSWLRSAASVSGGSWSRWAPPTLRRRPQDRWPVGGGAEDDRRRAVTLGIPPKESVNTAGELATGVVAR